MKVLKVIPAAVSALFGAYVSASAADVDSAYSKIDLGKCPIIDQNPDEGPWTLWRCEGYRGRPVFVAEGDLRFFVWLDTRESSERLSEQTLGPFNTIGQTLEWRLRKADDGTWTPFATILRYHTSYDEDRGKGEVLVVSQLVPGASCHIAYVDARSNKNANVLARQAADRLAGHFDCAGDPERVGNPGPSLGDL